MRVDAAPTPAAETVGVVGAVWRYPVKSMMGEELNAAAVTERVPPLRDDELVSRRPSEGSRHPADCCAEQWGKRWGLL